MKSRANSILCSWFSVLCVFAVVALGAPTVFGNPTITVTWECDGTPVDPDDYHIDSSTPAYPDVELEAECDSWKIKSEDGENPGDIGDITATGASNYGLEITDGSSGPGARDVKGIDLDPNDAAKYSKITGGSISGKLSGDMFLQRASGGSGGTLSFTIGGDVDGDMTIPIVSSLTINGDLKSSGSIHITDKIDGGRLTILGTIEDRGSAVPSIVIADMEGTGMGGLVVLESGSELQGGL